MECPEVIERLWEYLDGELAAKEASAIDSHLSDCESCRPRCQCDRTFLILLVRSLSRPCLAPPELRRAVRLRLLAAARMR